MVLGLFPGQPVPPTDHQLQLIEVHGATAVHVPDREKRVELLLPLLCNPPSLSLWRERRRKERERVIGEREKGKREEVEGGDRGRR